MAAEVSSLSRILNGGDNSDSGKSTALITRDLLGGRCTNTTGVVDFKELDLDMHVPSGWEKRLDLKSGKVYIQKRDSSPKSDHEKKMNGADHSSKLQDLNFPPSAKQQQPSAAAAGENNLDLKLVLFPTAAPSSSSTTSVCTLDKVKSALERAERENKTKRRSLSSMMSSSSSSPAPSHSSSDIIIRNSSSDNNQQLMDEEEEEKLSSTFAAGCPKCLLYVLVFMNNPKCPRCYSTINSPTTATTTVHKKPRIDLNISL